MDFFQHQDEARRSTRWLVFYFVLAVIAIVFSIHFAISGVLFFGSGAHENPMAGFNWFDLDRFVVFAGGTLLIITMASLYKILSLSGGGATVARLLGGRPIDPNTSDPLERRVVNVVEEMAIASGTPVPTVYVMDGENSINAFAAGFAPQDAVIGVTRGTLELLDRDELQGVIAHEFSHIFNGDMRLNLRLMGVLHGILVIALIGYFILRVTVRATGRSRRGGGAAAALPLVGLILVVIGYVGVFFGRVIKSAVSRQREFLADASAVQFTRNPSGIANALKKIGGVSQGSTIMSPNAEQASHFFFSDGKYGSVSRALGASSAFGFLATHPPLKDRIRRVDKSWNGQFLAATPNSLAAAAAEDQAKAEPDARQQEASKLFTALPAVMIAAIGTLDQAHLAYAKKMMAQIPDLVRKAIHEPSGARAVVLALLTDQNMEIRAKQVQYVRDTGNVAFVKETEQMIAILQLAPKEARLPLIDLALPALKRLSPAQYQEFKLLVDQFVRADNQIDLFEYTLMHILQRHLAPAFKKTKPAGVHYYSLNALQKPVSKLLSSIAHAGHGDEPTARKAFEHGAEELDGVTLTFFPLTEAGLTGVRDALEKVEKVSPKLKKDLMRAFIASVAYDGKVTVNEGELLRAIADAMGLPMPPFLPGQEVQSSAKDARAS